MPEAVATAEMTPAKIALKDACTLSIAWADGAENELDETRALCCACVCAQCVDEGSRGDLRELASVQLSPAPAW